MRTIKYYYFYQYCYYSSYYYYYYCCFVSCTHSLHVRDTYESLTGMVKKKITKWLHGGLALLLLSNNVLSSYLSWD